MTTGHLVPLALMSVWEPCGGILCANLPLTYRTLKRGVRHVGGTIGRSLRQRSTDREASHSEAELNNNNNNNNFNHDDWARNKRSAPSSSHGSAKKTYELDRYGEGRADTLHVDLASDQDLPGSMSQVHLAR
jgi:hypothetical protein